MAISLDDTPNPVGRRAHRKNDPLQLPLIITERVNEGMPRSHWAYRCDSPGKGEIGIFRADELELDE